MIFMYMYMCVRVNFGHKPMSLLSHVYVTFLCHKPMSQISPAPVDADGSQRHINGVVSKNNKIRGISIYLRIFMCIE